MSDKYLYTVYQTTNLVNKMIYVGVHKTDNPNDSYLGSGTWLKNAIGKYGRENFVKKILFEFSCPTAALLKECEIVNSEFVKRKDTYNLKIGGGKTLGILGYKFNKNQLLRMSVSQTKRWNSLSDTERRSINPKFYNANLGRSQNAIHKEKLKPYKFKVGREAHNSTPVLINGVEFNSITSSERILGISKNTIRYRLKSKNFPNYITKL